LCGASLLFAGCSNRPSEEFRRDLKAFIEAGSRLTSLGQQGVNFSSYSDQLATVKSRFDLIKDAWPKNYAGSARTDFDEAINAWSGAHILWKKLVNGETYEYGKQRIAEMRTFYPILETEDDGEKLPLRKNVRILLGEGSSRFEHGRSTIAGLK